MFDMNFGSLKSITAACTGEFLSGSPAASACRVRADSRQAQLAGLFLALPAQRFDGHDFLRDVAGKGAIAVVPESARAPALLLGCAGIAVETLARPSVGSLLGIGQVSNCPS